MQIKDVLPLLIPGVILQVLILAYYIRHCLQNRRLDPRKKTFYIIAMILLNLPAAAVYLWQTREKARTQVDDFQDVDVDANLRQGIFVILVVAFEVFALRLGAENRDNPHFLLLISLMAYCFVIMLLHHMLVKDRPSPLYYLLPAVQLLLAVPVEYLDHSYNAQFLVLIVAAGIINKFPLPLARPYSIAAFCAFLAGGTAKALKYYGALGFQGTVSYLYVSGTVFLLVIAAFYTLKKQLLMNKRLDAALQRVRQQARQLEEMGALAERNRITAQIHDMVGHRLTGAVVAIQAAQKLLPSEAEEALRPLTLAKEQVRQGLEDIRHSVRAIRAGDEMKFAPSLERLIGEIRQTTGLGINPVVELHSELLSIQRHILLQAVKECATNCVKHGGCAEADVLVQEYQGSLRLTFSDDGQGTERIIPGFGLASMKERVESIGGALAVDSAKGEGFTVNISIPTGIHTGGDPA